jgi:hypothetical protein
MISDQIRLVLNAVSSSLTVKESDHFRVSFPHIQVDVVGSPRFGLRHIDSRTQESGADASSKIIGVNAKVLNLDFATTNPSDDETHDLIDFGGYETEMTGLLHRSNEVLSAPKLISAVGLDFENPLQIFLPQTPQEQRSVVRLKFNADASTHGDESLHLAANSIRHL